MLGSPVDIALLFGVALLVFGPKKLPEIGKALGQGIGNFKRSISDAQDEVKSAIKAAEDMPSNKPEGDVSATNQATPGQAVDTQPQSPINPG
jgi:sec-independent protein translocase protein TatA